MNKYLLIILIFFSACSHLIETKEFENKCSRVEIIINNAKMERKLFNSSLTDTLNEKFDLLFKKSNNKSVDENLCKLTINIEKSLNSTLKNESGNTSRVNRQLKIKYNLKGDYINIDKTFIIFYGSNISEYVYSDHIKKKKEDINNINDIANKIYFGILNN